MWLAAGVTDMRCGIDSLTALLLPTDFLPNQELRQLPLAFLEGGRYLDVLKFEDRRRLA